MPNPSNDVLGGSVSLLVEKSGQMVSLASIVGISNSVNFVSSVRVKVGLLRVVEIEVTLDPPLEQAIALLRSGVLGIGFSVAKTQSKQSTTLTQTGAATTQASGPFANIFINKLAVQLNFGSLQSHWFKGLLLQPEIDIGVEGISITMKGIGTLFPVHQAMAPVGPELAGLTYQEAVAKLFKESDTQVIFTPEATNALSGIVKNSVQSKSHLEIIQDFLQQNNCKFVTLGHRTSPDQKQQVKVFHVKESRIKNIGVFVAYNQIDPTNRVFPLIGFSSPIQNLLLGGWGMGKQISSRGKNPGSQKFDLTKSDDNYSKRGPAVSNHDQSKAGGVSQGQTTGTGDAAGIPQPSVMQQLVHTTTSAVDLLKGYAQDFTDKVFEYDIVTIPVVDLLPGNLVTVKVADVAELSGVFDLIEVEHTITSGGGETRMSLVRTGGFVSLAADNVTQAIAQIQQSFGTTKTSTPLPTTPTAP